MPVREQRASPACPFWQEPGPQSHQPPCGSFPRLATCPPVPRSTEPLNAPHDLDEPKAFGSAQKDRCGGECQLAFAADGGRLHSGGGRLGRARSMICVERWANLREELFQSDAVLVHHLFSDSGEFVHRALIVIKGDWVTLHRRAVDPQ